MKLKLFTATVFLCSASANNVLAAMDESILLFPAASILCVEEQATGFDWKNKAWSQKNFRPDTKLVIRKLEPQTYKDAYTRSKSKNLLLCEDPKVAPSTNAKKGKLSGFVTACYEIKPMGQEPDILSYGPCIENWSEGLLQNVSCGNHYTPTYFHPDGAYITYPWHADIRRDVDKKDSLLISVGSCSRIN